MAEKSSRFYPGFSRLDALTKFAGMTNDQVHTIGFEIAMLGTRGIDVNSSAQNYTLRSLPGNFSGLHSLPGVRGLQTSCPRAGYRL